MNQNEVEEVYNSTYFKLNKMLLIVTRLWPYRPQSEKFIRRMTVYTTMSLLLLPNITKVHEQVTKNWLSIINTDEKSILIHCAKYGKIMTIIYTVYMSIGGFACAQATILPAILDLIIPLNESREKILIVRAEFGFDPFEYYYQLYAAYCVATVMGVTVFMGIDTTYAVTVQQNLGILSIVQHRLHVATKYRHESKYLYLYESKENDFAYVVVVKAILLHKEALELS